MNRQRREIGKVSIFQMRGQTTELVHLGSMLVIVEVVAFERLQRDVMIREAIKKGVEPGGPNRMDIAQHQML